MRRQVDERGRKERVERRARGASVRPWAILTGAQAPGAAQRRSPRASVSIVGRSTSTSAPRAARKAAKNGQRVDQVVRLRQADAAAGQRAGRRIGLRRLTEQPGEELVALAVRVGRILGQLGAHLGALVVLGAVAAADHPAALAGDLDDRGLEPAEVGALPVAAAAALALDHAGRRKTSRSIGAASCARSWARRARRRALPGRRRPGLGAPAPRRRPRPRRRAARSPAPPWRPGWAAPRPRAR